MPENIHLKLYIYKQFGGKLFVEIISSSDKLIVKMIFVSIDNNVILDLSDLSDF